MHTGEVAPPDPHAYDPASFDVHQSIDDKHFWFVGRNGVVAAALRGIIGDLPDAAHVLDVGCGNGNILRILEHECGQSVVVGLDPYMEGLQHARGRTSCHLVQGDIYHLPFARQFEMICALDVLEHLPDDRVAVDALRSQLASGGVLMVTVPARRSLWSAVDEQSGHLRRYEPSELSELLSDSGYEVEYLTPFMMGTYPLFWLSRRIVPLVSRQRRQAARDAHSPGQCELQIIPVLNGILSFLLAREAPMVARRLKLPVGTSLLAVARAC